jgi:uncharacterized protein
MAEASLSELIRAGTEAFNRGDHEAVLALLTEDIEWKRVDGLPDQGGTLHGKDAIRAWLAPDVFAEARAEPLEYVQGNGVVLVRSRFHARGAGSGIELDVETYTVYRVRDGLVWRVENWNGRDDAERSSGLTLGQST